MLAGRSGRSVQRGVIGTPRRQRDLIQQRNREAVERFLDDALGAGAAVDHHFVLTLNRLTLAGFPEEAEAGQYRTRPVVLKARDFILYVPPAAPLVAGLMTTLLDDVGRTIAADPVAAAGLAAIGILRIHPFVQGNGRVARAVATYTLRKAGYVARGAAGLQEYFDAFPSDYYGSIHAALDGLDVPWRRVFAEAVQSVFVRAA